MADAVGLGSWSFWLIIGFPAVLFVLLVLLGRLERWMIVPDERAAEVAQLLERAEEAEEVEAAVTRLLADVATRRRTEDSERARWTAANAFARRGRRRAVQALDERRVR